MKHVTEQDLQPIRLVTFDLYDTLIELVPHRWERLEAALQRFDLPFEPEALRRADVAAEDFYTRENGTWPIRDRGREERDEFRQRHMGHWLAEAGIVVDEETLTAVRKAYRGEFEARAVLGDRYDGYHAFEDVVRVMRRLEAAGIKRAVISNADDDVTALCVRLNFASEMDLIVTSALVGWEKPDVRTFRAAFETLDVDPGNALHIGDQYQSDVVGALAAGMRAAIIDRYDRLAQKDYDIPVCKNLDQLVDYVLAENERASAGDHAVHHRVWPSSR